MPWRTDPVEVAAAADERDALRARLRELTVPVRRSRREMAREALLSVYGGPAVTEVKELRARAAADPRWLPSTAWTNYVLALIARTGLELLDGERPRKCHALGVTS